MAKKPKQITLSELRKDLPMILAKVELLGEKYVVTKNGKKVFIIEPVKGDKPVGHPYGGGEDSRGIPRP